MCSSNDMIVDRQTHTDTYKHTQTDRHAHYNTPLPTGGGVKASTIMKNSKFLKSDQDVMSQLFASWQTEIPMQKVTHHRCQMLQNYMNTCWEQV